jgi:membrane protein implicated in regulation of membrane protease activity
MLLQPDLLGPQALPLLLVVAGLGLSIAEALAPGTHFVVIGVSLLAAGLVGLLVGPLASPFVLAALVLLFGAITLYGYREIDLYGGKGQDQTSDSDDLKGKTARVTERVTTSSGQVKVDGGGFSPYYSARTMDGNIPEGEEVLVVDPGGGNVITVESLGAVEGDLDRALERAKAENADTDEGADADTGGAENLDGGAEESADAEERDRETERN